MNNVPEDQICSLSTGHKEDSYADRHQGNPNGMSKDTTRARTRKPLPPRQGWEFDPSSYNLGIPKWKLSKNRRLQTITHTKNDYDPKNDTTLRQFPSDYESKYSQDVPSLLNLLKSNTPFDETSYELDATDINDFVEYYGINVNDAHAILASVCNTVFWLKDSIGDIYIWSRIDNSMLFLGHDMREALVNYLFHHDDLCYIDAYTHERITVKELEIEIEQKPRAVCIDAVLSLEPLEPLKGKSKKSEKKKKQKKNKKKH